MPSLRKHHETMCCRQTIIHPMLVHMDRKLVSVMHEHDSDKFTASDEKQPWNRDYDLDPANRVCSTQKAFQSQDISTTMLRYYLWSGMLSDCFVKALSNKLAPFLMRFQLLMRSKMTMQFKMLMWFKVIMRFNMLISFQVIIWFKLTMRFTLTIRFKLTMWFQTTMRFKLAIQFKCEYDVKCQYQFRC